MPGRPRAPRPHFERALPRTKERDLILPFNNDPLQILMQWGGVFKISGYGDTKQRRHKPVITRHAQVSGISVWNTPISLFFVAQLVVVKMSRSRMRRGDLLFQMR
jgi:hypothetical protein